MKQKFYLLPVEFQDIFRSAVGSGRAISIEDFAIGLDPTQLSAFPDFNSFQAAWLGSWKSFLDLPRNKKLEQREVFEFCQKLVGLFQLDLQ